MISIDEYYHVYNRGVEKRRIFLDNHDLWRFMTLLVVFQGDVWIPHVGRIVPDVRHLMFDKPVFHELQEKRLVESVCFCLMRNHFHLILREYKEGGISRFMQRLGDAYTKYFNAKYNRSGHLFEGRFKYIHIDRSEYLNHLSAYIHVNPGELSSRWRGREEKYFWSSFQDFLGDNRWGSFLAPQVIQDQFSDPKDYRRFVYDADIKGTLPSEHVRL